MSPTRRKPSDELDYLADAVGVAVGGAKGEIDALADAVGVAIASLSAEIGAEIAPAKAAAQARASFLTARRAETISTLVDWLGRCADDGA